MPEFVQCPFYGRIGLEFCKAGYEDGFEKYSSYIEKAPNPPLGSVIKTLSGGSRIPYMLHLVCADLTDKNIFPLTRKHVREALRLAEDCGFQRILISPPEISLPFAYADDLFMSVFLSGISVFMNASNIMKELMILAYKNEDQYINLSRGLQMFEPTGFSPAEPFSAITYNP